MIKDSSANAVGDVDSRATPAGTFERPAEADWHRMISEEAYLLAEKRDFAGGHELEDWLEAEEHVRRTIAGQT